MSARSLPVRPALEQLRRQAKELLAAVRAGEPGSPWGRARRSTRAGSRWWSSSGCRSRTSTATGSRRWRSCSRPTRHPQGKHACLELFVHHGIGLPDTPTMALHRGRVDLLERHLARDARLFERSFTHAEIWPPALGCHADESLALHGAPLAGGTLLHLAVDYDELELARWMLARSAPADARAARDAAGFGGHTALFGCVVSQPWRVGARRDDAFAQLLLEQGADAGIRASLAKRLRFVADETRHEYADVTALEFGRRFHDQDWVNPGVVALLAALPAGKPWP